MPELEEAPLAPSVQFEGDYHTAQIYSKGFEFAFMSRQEEVYRQVCTFVHCKDFLHDAVWAFLNQKAFSIYGFSYDPKKHLPLQMDHLALAFRNNLYRDKPQDFHALYVGCLDFLNQIEARLGFEPTKIYQVSHKEGPCWLLIADKRWQHAPPALGFYTLFARVGCAHKAGANYLETLEKCQSGQIQIGDGNGSAGTNDPNYIARSWKGLQVFLEHGLDNFHPSIEENYPEGVRKKLSLHDCVGPVNWTAGSARNALPGWYKHLDAKGEK